MTLGREWMLGQATCWLAYILLWTIVTLWSNSFFHLKDEQTKFHGKYSKCVGFLLGELMNLPGEQRVRET